MRRWIVLAPLVLGGCGTGFYVADESCGQDFLSWTGGLTYHLLQGTKDGTFDYDPPGVMLTRVAGSYDLGTGDFSWGVEYAPEHWRTGTTVAGYGYAKTDGDLDVDYEISTTDVLGNVGTAEIREERIGCDVTRRTNYGVGDSEWHYGRYENGVYDYSDESTFQGEPWVVEGTLYPDHTYEEELGFVTTGLRYTYSEAGDADGYSRRDFLQVDTTAGRTTEGYLETFLDGSEHAHYTSDGATWDYTTDYEGDGTGTWTSGSTTCNLTFTNGNCRYNCGGSTGDC